VDELELTDGEIVRVARVCAWVRMTAAFLPYLREFVAHRLAGDPELSGRIVRLSDRQVYRLWEYIKEEERIPAASIVAVQDRQRLAGTSKV
jgi:hypothetical protein